MHSQKSTPAIQPAEALSSAQAVAPLQAVRRITSAALLEERREVEIEHAGKIYRLRVTQLNKLILTA